MSVVDFPRRTVTGPARCTACRREWVAVAPFDERFESLECPGCGLNKGVITNHYAPVGETIWMCSCGCEVFHLVIAGDRYAFYCINCGASTEFP